MTTKDLWNLTPSNFNQWRKDNDIPILINFFCSKLPDFEIWKKEFYITNEILLEVDNIGLFFQGKDKKFLYQYENYHGNLNYGFIDPKNSSSLKNMIRISKKQETKYWIFKPYLEWAKIRNSWNRLKEIEKKEILNRFMYTVGSAPNSPKLVNWRFADDLKVTKLGGVTVKSFINERNLDFTNLDYLTVKGDYHGNSRSEICYSHIADLTIKNAKWNFVIFRKCSFQNLKIINSNLQDFIFIECDLFGLEVVNSSLLNFSLIKTSFTNFSCINSKLIEFEYTPPKEEWFQLPLGTIENNMNAYKEIRVAYQNIGLVDEAKKYFAKEKEQRLFLSFGKISFRGLWYSIRKFRFDDIKEIFQSNYEYLFIGVKLGIGYILWDFGRKPSRLILHWLLIIFFFGIIFYNLENSPTNNNFIESLRLSAYSMTRIGFDNSLITDNFIRLTIGIEALIGWIMIPLIVAGFINKSRY